jgi:ATP-dependent DNA helicase RecQ
VGLKAWKTERLPQEDRSQMSTPREQALRFLQQVVGDASDFRPGQWEAIEALVNRPARLLLVQRTGWGKSLVYFVTTRILRDRGAGPTLLVSPLLALMRNQIAAATRLSIKAVSINSTNPNEWGEIAGQLQKNTVDVLLISPERIANETFQKDVLIPVAQKAGLFVVDEAHCISDWGHDFRPDYRRIVSILQQLPANIPVCATTATANRRVVADITTQLGSDLRVIRGPLVRESLRLQTVPLSQDAAKLAWLGHYLPRLPGSGIVYALTVRWTERIARWLRGRGIAAVAYSAELTDQERQKIEQQLLNNQIKALVATTALGMGFDKPDLGFVVHFHQPGSVVHYYQQVGRAGRGISQAYGIMLSGGDDRDIIDYFIAQAFPPEEAVAAVLEALEKSDNGLAMRELEALVNLSRGRIEQVLKTLAVEAPPPIARLENCWVSTTHRYDPQRRRRLVDQLTQLRHDEQAQMDAYLHHKGCLMEFLVRALDDPAAGPCGRCAPCQGKPEVLRQVPEDLTREAIAFLRRSDLPIKPRAQWQLGAFPLYGWQGRISAEQKAEPGRALCILGDAGWGELVRRGKYEDHEFSDELVEALASLVRGWKPSPSPAWVTCVPSLNPAHRDLIPDLANRLAIRLGLPFVPAVRKVRTTSPQKEMQNSWQQAHNLDGAFRIETWKGIGTPVLLVDDMVDSGWTFTVIAALLRSAGAGQVFPVALAANR